jgi:hypothetical protein
MILQLLCRTDTEGTPKLIISEEMNTHRVFGIVMNTVALFSIYVGIPSNSVVLYYIFIVEIQLVFVRIACFVLFI